MKRYSQRRQAIRDALDSVTTHPTATEIYDMVREQYPSISLATVYRNLTEFSHEGSALMLHAGDGMVHFDGCTRPHDHFVCERCNGVSDIEAGDDCPSEMLGNSVSRRSIFYYGVCRDCLASKS